MISKKLLLTLFVLTTYAHADDQVRAMQEELRRRNLYFGDVDGQRTPELQEATKRYQKRKNFPATGSEDRDTLRSLGLLARDASEPPPEELVWPSEPVLKSDAKIDVAAEASKIATAAGVAPESISSAAESTPQTIAAAEAAAAALKTASLANAPVSRSQRRAAAAEPLLARSELNDLQQFVGRYMKALGRNDVRDELKLYGDRVSYYANGEVDRRIIERNLKRYYQRWPSRKYTVDKIMKIKRVPSRGEIVVTFMVNFTLKNRGQKVRGQSQNRLTINAASADPRIVAIQEDRVRS